MSGSSLRIRRVRRYRKARYPSLSRASRPSTLKQRLVRAAAVPAAALGLGAAGGACDNGLSLSGEDPDAREDVTVVEDDAGTEPDSMIAGGRPEGEHYTRYLTEAEGRALIREVVNELTPPLDNGCPALSERLLEDAPLAASGVEANIDLLANAVTPDPFCAHGPFAAAGFEFLTDEAGDDQDLSGDAAGLTDAEETRLVRARAEGTLAVHAIRAVDFPYDVVDYGWVDDSDRARSEALVRDTVRALVDELLRDGLI